MRLGFCPSLLSHFHEQDKIARVHCVCTKIARKHDEGDGLEDPSPNDKAIVFDS